MSGSSDFRDNAKHKAKFYEELSFTSIKRFLYFFFLIPKEEETDIVGGSRKLRRGKKLNTVLVETINHNFP